MIRKRVTAHGQVKPLLSASQVEKLLKIPTDWGIETREEEINKFLYGQRTGRRR